MRTVKQIIEGAARELGALPGGQEMDSDEIQDYLIKLVQMLDSWSLHDLIIPFLTAVSFSLDKAKNEYTWGTGGDFEGPRPMGISVAWLRDQAGNDIPLRVVDEGRWSRVRVKHVVARPQFCYYEPSFPLATLRLETYPYDPTLKAFVQMEMQTVTSLTEEMIVPPGYELAIQYSLAVHSAPSLDRPISKELNALASSTFDAIKRKNSKPKLLKIPYELQSSRRRFDIYSGPGGE